MKNFYDEYGSLLVVIIYGAVILAVLMGVFTDLLGESKSGIFETVVLRWLTS